MDTQTKKEIITEVNAPAALRANLDVVDTVLGFLSSGGGKPDVSLGKYVEKVLKMKKGSFSGKVFTSCSGSKYLLYNRTIVVNTHSYL